MDNRLINIRELLKSFIEIAPDTVSIKDKNVEEYIKNDMQLSDGLMERLKDACNVDLLNPNDEIKNTQDIRELGDTKLLSVRYVIDSFSLTNKHSQTLETKLLKELRKLNEAPVSEENMIKLPDVILTLQISQSLTAKSKKKFSWSEEFYVLGETYLTSLKDLISCFRNEIHIGEFSENPELLETSPQLKDKIPSGFFLIENIIYSDSRNNTNDCTVEILKWASENNIPINCSKKMEETKFIDLNLRLGQPYLYTHVGNCEHLIIFQNIKLVNPSFDCYDKTKYPLLKDRNRGRLLHCWLCNVIYAKWVIQNSELLVDDPCLLCQRCFENTHFDENKKKLGNFKAYHFSQFI